MTAAAGAVDRVAPRDEAAKGLAEEGATTKMVTTGRLVPGEEGRNTTSKATTPALTLAGARPSLPVVGAKVDMMMMMMMMLRPTGVVAVPETKTPGEGPRVLPARSLVVEVDRFAPALLSICV